MVTLVFVINSRATTRAQLSVPELQVDQSKITAKLFDIPGGTVLKIMTANSPSKEKVTR